MSKLYNEERAFEKEMAEIKKRNAWGSYALFGQYEPKRCVELPKDPEVPWLCNASKEDDIFALIAQLKADYFRRKRGLKENKEQATTYILTCDPINFTLSSTKNGTTIEYNSYREWIDTLISVASLPTIGDVRFTSTPPKNAIARLQFTPAGVKIDYTWDDYSRMQNQDSNRRRENGVNRALINEVIDILTSKDELYAEDLLKLYKEGILRKYLEDFTYAYSRMYDTTFETEFEVDALGSDKTFRTTKESLVDLIREYQSIRWLIENDIKKFDKAQVSHKTYYFGRKQDALDFCLKQETPSIVHINKYDGGINYKVVVKATEDDNASYDFSISRMLYGDINEDN